MDSILRPINDFAFNEALNYNNYSYSTAII